MLKQTMSKWLRRENTQNTPSANHHNDRLENARFPEATGNSEIVVGNNSTQPMVGYGASSANIAMEVDPHNQRYGSSSKAFESRSRSSRSRADPEEGHRNRSTRSSSRGTSNRPRYPQQSSGSHFNSSSRQGSVGTPTGMTPSSQHFTPPNPHYGHRQTGTATPPPESLQPTFPPPAVTQESPQSEQAARRPAYLLHRDLVIGKGSYGQVCIASRGEAEGHTSGRSGKRKKFACKCVMLRNDPKYISKLQEEVNVLRELRGHDNVIRLYDVFCVDNELFIITELGRGGDLFHLLTTHPKHGVTEGYAGKFSFRTVVHDRKSSFSNIFSLKSQPKRSLKCSRLLHFCTLKTSVTEI